MSSNYRVKNSKRLPVFKRALMLITLVEFIAVVILLKKISINLQPRVLGETKVTPINKNQVQIFQDDNLNNYYEPKPNQLMTDNVEWLSNQAQHHINSDTLNEHQDYTLEKTPETFRIIALGDSHTFGQYVDTKDSYPKQLERLFNTQCAAYQNYEIINLGFGGYDIQYSLQRFKLRGIKYQPDLVIWFLKNDDFTELVELFYDRVKEIDEKLSDEEKNQLQKKGNYFYSWEAAYSEFAVKQNFDNIMKQQIVFLNEFLELHSKKTVFVSYNDETKKVTETLSSISRSHNQVYLFKDLNFNDIDRLPDKHPSVLGYKAISENLFDYLVSQNVVSCLK